MSESEAREHGASPEQTQDVEVAGKGALGSSSLVGGFNGSQPAAMLCPNCGSRLEGRKCKLFCLRPGCGYQVTCAEW